MKLKSQQWIWRSRCPIILAKRKFEKNKNLQAPWGMEDSTLPSVGQASKNGGVVHPFSQKAWPILQTSKKNKKFNFKISKKFKK
jgi:hypothetical protein